MADAPTSGQSVSPDPVSPSPASEAVRARKNILWRKTNVGYLFLLPNISGFMLFTLIPVVVSLGLSLFSWDILQPARFVGLQNFVELFKDRDFWRYLWNTVYLMAGIPINMLIALLVAMLINRKLPGIIAYRTIYFTPVISPMVAVAMLWRLILNGDTGLLNATIRMVQSSVKGFLTGIAGWFQGSFVSDALVGLANIAATRPPNWLGDPAWSKPALILTGMWGFGYSMLLYLAALQSIPEDLYEAARIDGASAWTQFWKITWPMLSFVNFFIIIMSVIGGFQAFGIQYVMTQGGPAGSTTTIVYYIYRNAFEWFKMGYASAIAWVLFGIIFALTIIQWNMRKRMGEYF
jgi:multiple sugar transport system permease protein